MDFTLTTQYPVHIKSCGVSNNHLTKGFHNIDTSVGTDHHSVYGSICTGDRHSGRGEKGCVKGVGERLRFCRDV